jgi:hypothetical protein
MNSTIQRTKIPHMKATEAVQMYFDRAAERINLPESMCKLLKLPSREVTVEVPV